MKIGFDARFLKETGVGRYIQNILPLMISSSSRDTWVLLYLKGDKPFLKSLIPPESLKRVKFVETTVRWHSLREQVVVPIIFYRENVNILHVPYINVPVFYFKKLVTTIHDLTILSHKTGRASTHSSLIYNLKRIGFKIAIFRAIHSYQILTVSNSVREDLINRFPKINRGRIHVTTNGYSKLTTPKNKKEIKQIEDFFKEKGIKKNKPYIFYVGNLHPHKNIDKTLETLNKFFSKYPNFSFVIAGRKDYFMDRTMNLVNTFDNKDKIHFFPNPTDGQLSLLYRCSKLVLLPSLKEGFGLQVLEAMSLKSLILCSKIPAYLEVGGEICDYFDPSSERSLILALNKSLSYSKKAKERVVESYVKNLKKYSWRQTAKRTLLAYSGSLDQVRKNLRVISADYK